MTTPDTTADPTLDVMPAPRPAANGALLFVLVTVALDMVALGIIAPVFAPLVVQFLAGNDSKAAALLAVFGTSFALMQFVCSPVLGVLSDRFGRKIYAIYRYHWDSRAIGLSLAFVGISSAVVQAAATGPLVKKLGERRALRGHRRRRRGARALRLGAERDLVLRRDSDSDVLGARLGVGAADHDAARRAERAG